MTHSAKSVRTVTVSPAATRMPWFFDEQTVSRVVHRAHDSQLPLYSGSARILRLFSPPR